MLTDLLAAAKPHGLTFGADPSSGSRATLGGMIANNACGAHSVAWGTTADNVRSLDVILADGTRCTVESRGARDELANRPGREGELHRSLQAFVDEHELVIRRRFGRFTRQISGYALHRLLPEHGYDVAGLLCGSEGGFAATLRATLALTPLPTARVLCVLGFPDSVSSAECVSVVLAHSPLTMESINVDLVDRLPGEVRRAAIEAGLPAGRAWLLVEMGGEDRVAAEMSAEKMLAALRDSGSSASASLVTDPGAQAVLWRCRRDAAGLATRRADGAEAWGGWEDAAVPPERLADYLRGLDELMARYGLSGASYGHFGEGCMHMRIDFDLLSAHGVAAYRSFVEEATDLVVALGGSVSGEHGDGRARSELLGRMYGADGLALMAEMKDIWDPHRLMNPGVIVDPPPLDAGIRLLGPAKDRKLLTLFSYPDDNDDFAQAQRRCVGIGKCRQSSGGVMCPSYQATHDEMHSTRGRAHLLWEMLQRRPGDRRLALDRGARRARSVPVLQGMSFGLSGQRGHGDVQGRVHPPSLRQQAVGPAAVALVDGLAAAVVADRIEGAATGEPHGGHVAGEAPRRDRARTRRPGVRRADVHVMVRAAPGACPIGHQGRRSCCGRTASPITLLPQVGRAAVAVLEAAGYEVILPGGHVCCGLTWISTGQLRTAKRRITRSLDVLAPQLESGIPIVGLEPSCTAVLRRDAVELLHDDSRAAALAASTVTFAEFLTRTEWQPPNVAADALVQTHCHQHAVLGFDADRALMEKAGIRADVPDSGCCGLAGNFGFERGHYDVSRAVGERVLLPAVRNAAPTTAVIADGFSCRTQIAQGTPRRAVHLAEVLAAALDS